VKLVAAAGTVADPPAGPLRARADTVAQVVGHLPLRAVAVADVEARWDWYRKVEDAVLDLSGALPQGTEDYDGRKLFEFMVALRRAITADEDGADEAGEVDLARMRMGDVVHRIVRRLEHDELDDPRVAADAVFATLGGVPVGDVARLLGVSTKTVGAWRAGRPVTRNALRVVVVAQILTYLRASLTPLGLVLWFDSARDELGGRSPLEVLSAGGAGAREELVALARGLRGQLAD